MLGTRAVVWLIGLSSVSLIATSLNGQSGQTAGPAPDANLVAEYCVRCHSARLHTAGLVLDPSALADAGKRPEIWEKVLQKLQTGAMPPPGAPRPDAASAATFVSALAGTLDRAALALPNAGRTDALHRLNRAEYHNAVRDLLGVDVDAASLLPADDADVNGFDNSAGLLSISPALLERYMSAARKISRLALGIPPASPATDTYAVPDLAQQDRYVDDELPFGTRGGIAVLHRFPADGEYVIKIRMRRQIYDYITGLDRREQIDVRVDRERVSAFAVGGEDHGRPAPQSFAGDVPGSPDWEKYALNADANLRVRLHVRAGAHTVGVSFVDQFTESEGVTQPKQRYGDYSRDESREQGIEGVAISGPFGAQSGGAAPALSGTSLSICSPVRAAAEEPCARRILTKLIASAYRRPATAADVDALMAFYLAGRRDGNFRTGLQFAVERVLADPRFLFRIERDPVGWSPNTAYRLSSLELASRLSFFLWSSIPDEHLLDVARRGELTTPSVLERETRRMLADPRAHALIDNFAGQWLLLRNVQSIKPDPDLFPDFDEELRVAFAQEAQLFLGSQLHEDRSVTDLLAANYTFVNERLARHYGIPNVYGSRFRRVTLPKDDPRAGLLGQGAVLLVTSYPNRTSPVLRGKWVLDSMLGTPPPQPPPNVPALKDRGENGRPASVRQRLEEHRKDPACATCHTPMDPLGFALENFDAIGKWRTADAGTPIDASAVLPDRSRFDGPLGLRSALLARRDQFATAVTEKLLSYALGRGLEYFDGPAVRHIVRESASNDYRWSSIVLGIVESTPFTMRQSMP